MNCSDAEHVKPTVRSELACDCGDPKCPNRRLWEISVNVPMIFRECPLLIALAETTGVDGVQITGRYTALVKIAEAFDDLGVMQSLKDNVLGLPPLDIKTGLAANQPLPVVQAPGEDEIPPFESLSWWRRWLLNIALPK